MTEWVEPKDEKRAGHGTFGRPLTDYDRFMESEGIPIFRGFGVPRCQDLPMKPWARMGGNGTYVQLYGTEGTWGMYVCDSATPRVECGEAHLRKEHHGVGRAWCL